jgi:hypothetical protein
MHHAIAPLFAFIVLGAVSLVGLLELIFQIWMLVDAIQNPRLEGSQRIVWVLVIILLPCLGPVLYFFVGRGR